MSLTRHCHSVGLAVDRAVREFLPLDVALAHSDDFFTFVPFERSLQMTEGQVAALRSDWLGEMPVPRCVGWRCPAIHRWDTTRESLQLPRTAPEVFCHALRHRLYGVFAELVFVNVELLLERHVPTHPGLPTLTAPTPHTYAPATLSLRVQIIPMTGEGLTQKLLLVLGEVGVAVVHYIPVATKTTTC